MNCKSSSHREARNRSLHGVIIAGSVLVSFFSFATEVFALDDKEESTGVGSGSRTHEKTQQQTDAIDKLSSAKRSAKVVSGTVFGNPFSAEKVRFGENILELLQGALPNGLYKLSVFICFNATETLEDRSFIVRDGVVQGGKNKKCFLRVSCNMPTADNSKYKVWKENKDYAMSVRFDKVKNGLLHGYIDLKTKNDAAIVNGDFYACRKSKHCEHGTSDHESSH